jgi:hypothetical protein
MLTAIISPAVVAVLIVCITLLILAFRFTNSAGDVAKEYQEAVDQLIEDHAVFHEGLESRGRDIEELKKKLSNIALGKIR